MLEHSKTWINFNYVCVAVAFFMLGACILLMNVELAMKGYLAMGVVFLAGSLVTLVKTLHDQRVAGDVTSKLERAKQDKLLQEYVENN
jgi:hypothetical protein